MLTFLPGYAWFALAGMAAATAPLIIHLLNRRRFKVVNWAAMDFLKEAVQRNRRVLHLRDLLLLLLRTAALLFFGWALSRPFFQNSGDNLAPNQPLHVALVVDNSLSMGYQRSLGTRHLDEAKTRAQEFLETLPERSLVAVIPLCGSEYGNTRDSYRNVNDAIEAIDRIDTVDRRGTVSQGIALALEAFSASELPESAHLIALVSDNQTTNWPRGDLQERFANLPKMVVIDVATKEPTNTWVEEVSVNDGVADVQTPATILAKIRHEGKDARKDLQVTLAINGEIKDSRKVELQPGQTLEVPFQYRFEPEDRVPGLVNSVKASVALSPDSLPADDVRHLIVPVVAELPVIFVDQLGARGEDPKTNRYGETYHLRRLLAPKTSSTTETAQLLKIQHLTLDELTRDALREARLVVIAGVAEPGDAVPLLREYVQQGGPLLIAAGGNFDPAQWQEQAWKEGRGILPAPLAPQLVGKLADEITSAADLITMNPDTLSHGYFQFPDTPQAEHRRIYTSPGMSGVSPVIFKVVESKIDNEFLTKLLSDETKRLTAQRADFAELAKQEADLLSKEKNAPLSGSDAELRERQRNRRAELEPNWLTWRAERAATASDQTPPEKLAELGQPRVLAGLSNKLPLILERNIGHGSVTFIGTGLLPKWNMLPLSDVFVVFERIARSKIEGTLPQRNLSQVDQFTLSVSDNLARYTLQRPAAGDGEPREEPLAVEALGPEEYGVIARNITQRGVYRILTRRGAAGGIGNEVIETVSFAVNGPSEESILAPLGKQGFETLIDKSASAATATPATGPTVKAPIVWLERGVPISLEGATVWGQNLWWWLALAVLLCLMAEMMVLFWPSRSQRPVGNS